MASIAAHSPLAKLLYTLKYDADLSLFGRIACRKMILRNLSNKERARNNIRIY